MADVTMPQLGESVTEGTLGKWLKSVGDTVRKYEPLVEVMTDKVNAEIPSDFDGVLTEIHVSEGETVRVGSLLARVDTGDVHTASSRDTDSDASDDTQEAGGVETGLPTAVGTDSESHAAAARGRFSPAVLRLAEEHGVNLSDVRGTGEGGRVTRKDVLNYTQSGQAKKPLSDGMSPSPSVQPATAQTGDRAGDNALATGGVGKQPSHAASIVTDVEVLQPNAMRKTIAERMVHSKHTAPHAWMMVEVDVTGLVNLRERAKGDFLRREGITLTYLPFFIKAVAEGLKEYPMMNASWQDDGIHVHKRIHISVAVATDDALVVPVIKDADRQSIAGLAHSVNDLAARARSNRLQLQDVTGGTFTVNNTGAFGSILSQPILNHPQGAILSVESIVKRPVVIDDAIAIRSMVNLCLSLDHRLLDGWIAGQFLKSVKQRLQQFDANTVLY